MRKLILNRGGFTLVELLVSIAIIAMISTLVMTDYAKNGKAGNLRMGAQKMASDIRLMQGNSLGLRNFQGNRASGGWGFRGKKTDGYYYLFADMDGNRMFTAGELYQKVDLPPGITITNIEADGDANKNILSTVYLPPDPKVKINITDDESALLPAPPLSDWKKSVLTLTDAQNNSIKVVVNIFGLVDVITE